jgi:serine/threonine-protein kinase
MGATVAPNAPVSSSVAHASTQAAPISVGTQPRGEVVSVPPTHKVGAPSKMPLVIGGAVVAVAAVAAALIVGLHKPEPTVESKVPVAAQPTVLPPPVVAAPPPVGAPPVTGPVEAHAAHPAGDKPPPDKDKSPPDKKVTKNEAVPPEVKADLDEAAALLKKNDYDGALHIARRTLTVKKTSAAFALITTAYCQQGDLGNAKANFSSVGAGDRARVVAVCKKHEIDLK